MAPIHTWQSIGTVLFLARTERFQGIEGAGPAPRGVRDDPPCANVTHRSSDLTPRMLASLAPVSGTCRDNELASRSAREGRPPPGGLLARNLARDALSGRRSHDHL